MKQNAWRPILKGIIRRRAAEAVDSIAEDIRAKRLRGMHDVRSEDWVFASDGGLSAGSAGVAIFFAYRSVFTAQNTDRELAGDLIEDAMIRLRPSAALYSGFPGNGWAIAHLRGWILDGEDDDENDPFEEIDSTLLRRLSSSSWPDHYDLISGLVGLGVYALERLPNARAEHLLERIVYHLSDLSRSEPEGASWVTPPHLLSSQERANYPNTAIVRNIGLAHGVPGVIGMLGRVCEAGIAASCEASELLRDATRWLIAQDQGTTDMGGFAHVIADGITPRVARLGWCYGDLGIAAALLLAARGAGDSEVEEVALRVARRAALRPERQSGVVDAELCHGAAGVAHIFNRLFQATNEIEFYEAAVRWFDRTLEMRTSGGVGGYRTWGPNRSNYVSGELSWQNEPGFLTGAAGIGLALTAAISDLEPNWDRVLLTSVAPRSGNACSA